jgi:hypothetical protein
VTVVLANNVSSTLATDLSATAGSMRVKSGTGTRFPTLPAGRYFYATIIATDGRWEIVKATARSVDLITIIRAQESTQAAAFPMGSRVELRITAQSVLDAIDDVSVYVGTSPPPNPSINDLWVDTN